MSRSNLITATLLLGLLGAAPPALAQHVVPGDYLAIGSACVNSTDPACLAGLPARTPGQDVVSAIDATGNLGRGPLGTADIPSVFTRRDLAETIGQAWLFSLGVTGPFRVSGGSSPDVAIGADNVRFGINAGTPRVVWEDAGFNQWTIDNLQGVLRYYRTNSAGSADTVPFSLSDVLTIDPKGKALLPNLSYDINLGSPLRKFLSVNAAELNVETLVAQSVAATIGGRVLVLPTTYLLAAIDSTQTTIQTKHNNLANGDRIYLEGDGRVEFMAVTSSATTINKCSVNCDADNTGSWNSNTSTLTLSRGIRWQGDASINVSAATNADVYHFTAGNFANSTAYVISVYIKRSDGAAVVPVAGGAYQMYCRDGVGSTIGNAIADDVGDGWYRLHATCTTGTSGNDIVGVHNMPAGVTHFIDAVQIEPGSTLTPWSLTSSSYTVTRDLDGTGGNYWEAGAAIANTGQTGNGFIDLYSTRGVRAGTEIGPTIAGNVRQSSTYNDWAPRWAIGNLNGLYGYAVTTFGAAFGDASATNVTIDVPNGFRVRNGTSDLLQFDTSGNGFLTGHLAIGSGVTAFSTGTGLWMDYNAGTPQFRVGNPSGNYLSWNGSALAVQSDHVKIPGNLTDGIIIDTAGSGSFANRNAYSVWNASAMLGGISGWGDSTSRSINIVAGAGFVTGALAYGTGASHMEIGSYGMDPLITKSIIKLDADPANNNATMSLVLNAGGSTPAPFTTLTIDATGTGADAVVQLVGYSPTLGSYINFVSSANLFAFATIPSSTSTSNMYPVTWSSNDNVIRTRRDVLTTTVTVGGCTMTFNVGLLTAKSGC